MAHLKLIGSADADVLLKLAGAIRIVERKCGPIAEQTVKATYQQMPTNYRLLLPAFIAKEVTAVTEDGDAVNAADYELEQTDYGAVLKLKRSLAVPIAVTAVLGWPAASVPADIKAGVLIMLGHLHDVRQLAVVRGGGAPELWPMTVESQCSLYQSWMRLVVQQQ
jgi:hypothetical protein